MKKLVLATSLLFLSACSEEVEQSDNEATKTNAETTVTQESEGKGESGKTAEEEHKSTSTADQSEDEESAEDELDNVDVKASKTESVENTKQSVDISDIKEVGLFNYYSNEEFEKDVEFTNIDEVTLELPLYSENEDIFEENIVKINLEDFQSGEIEYFEEPISNGYLIALNLNKLSGENYGKSYSLMYNDIEYAFFITEDDPNYALAVIENVDLESVKKAQLLIMK